LGVISTFAIFVSLAVYFGLISLLGWLSQRRKQDTQRQYFLAGRKAPWLLVAIGMVGSSLSGLTFISVPGKVGLDGMEYFQLVLGYMVGYVLIAQVLLPLYYRLQLTSIYGYLGLRYGRHSYLVGAAYFLLSRSLGSAVRLFLAVSVLQAVLFAQLGIPFWLTATLTMGFILSYTYRGGLSTVLYTDVLQTLVMLGAASLVFALLFGQLGSPAAWHSLLHSPLARIWVWDATAPNYFWKHFVSGIFITLVMTGLDQDMMQKNLSIPRLGQAQRNVYLYSLLILLANLLFLGLGVLLYTYAAQIGWRAPAATDHFFPLLALQQLGPLAGIAVVVGLVAAAYNSADGTLTALTTSTCVDVLRTERLPEARGRAIRHRVHLLWAGVFLLCILGFGLLDGGGFSAIDLALRLAGYTYGPLLGLFAFGLLSRRRVRDNWVPLLCLLCPLLCLGLQLQAPTWWGYSFGFELLLINGLLTYLGLLALSVPARR
jgi:Na+/proline symporter